MITTINSYVMGFISADEFTKLFSHMTERFDRIDKTLEAEANSADLQTALGLLDYDVKFAH